MILARGTSGFSGAELQNMVKCVVLSFARRGPLTGSSSLAAIQAAKEGCKEVALTHFEWAKVSSLLTRVSLYPTARKDRIVMGAERKSAYIDEKNKLLTAYHEVRWFAIGQDAPCSNLHRGATP